MSVRSLFSCTCSKNVVILQSIYKFINDMDKNQLLKLQRELEELFREWYCAGKKKEKDLVEKKIWQWGNRLPDEVYCGILPGMATGLFSYGHFESDIQCAFAWFRKEIEICNSEIEAR